MARKKNVQWLKNSLNEVLNIADYIEQEFGTVSAHKFILKIQQKTDQLSGYPDIGRPSKRFITVKFILVGKYHRIYYRIHGANLFIVHIFDTRQDPAKDTYR